MMSIGERVKALRTEQGMTLAELGEKTSLSTSYLSQIERDKTTPSLATLTGIAKTLNVPLRSFFETDAEAAFVVRADGVSEHVPAEAFASIPLTPKAENNKLEVYRVVLGPGAHPEPSASYPGEEFVFVILGELTIAVGDEQFVLAEGDSIHYDALQPHRWSNKGAKPCVAFWSHSASRSERQP